MMTRPDRNDELSVPPKLAVLIPAWNPGDGLMKTLHAVCAQQVHCEIFVVDDGNVPAIELPAQIGGKAIRLLRQESNQGITAALNTGLRTILDEAFEFVARSDCADVDHIDRLQRQMAFLKEHPDVALVGSSVRFDTPNRGLQYVFQAPPTNVGIKRRMHYSAALVHPSCMFRASALREIGFYSDRYPHAEDYELFFRMLEAKRGLHNLTDVLVTAAYNPNSISMSNRRASLLSRLRLQIHYFDYGFIHSYLGLMQTLSLWVMPYSFVCWLKAKPLRRH